MNERDVVFLIISLLLLTIAAVILLLNVIRDRRRTIGQRLIRKGEKRWRKILEKRRKQ